MNRLIAMIIAACLFTSGCADSSSDDGAELDSGTDTDSDTDTDTDTDTDSDTDTDTDTDSDTDTDTDTDFDSGPDPDAGADAGFDGILCGSDICPLPEVCCTTEEPVSQECAESNDECAGADFIVTCDGPEDCYSGAGHCCLPSGAVSATFCMQDDCFAGEACHFDYDCPEDQFCCPAEFFGWSYNQCSTYTCP